MQPNQYTSTSYEVRYTASEVTCTSRESAMHLRVKCIAFQEKRIIQVHLSVHFGALEMRCTSIWVRSSQNEMHDASLLTLRVYLHWFITG